jgi:four helix bundle protein
MDYQEWLVTVPEVITGDKLWTVNAYRLALFIADIGWHDVTKLIGDRRTLSLSDQLYRSLGSISANLAEGYSRGSNKDRVRFYEYALGSARESRDWYYKARPILGGDVTAHRLDFLTKVIRLILTMVSQQRGYAVHEEKSDYVAVIEGTHSDELDEHHDLLEHIPMP